MTDQTGPRAVPGRRSSTLLLQTVNEFHKRGYQGLRIIPRVETKPWVWRCFLAHGRYMDPTNGAFLPYMDPGNSLPYSSTVGSHAGWADLGRGKPGAVVDDMLERFGGFLEAALHDDFEYAGWFVKVLGRAEAGYFPSVARPGPGAGDKPVRLYAWPDPRVPQRRRTPLPPVPKPVVPNDKYL